TWDFLPDVAFDALVAQIFVVQRREDGSTLLDVVADWKHSEQVVRNLLEAGVPPDVCSVKPYSRLGSPSCGGDATTCLSRSWERRKRCGGFYDSPRRGLDDMTETFLLVYWINHTFYLDAFATALNHSYGDIVVRVQVIYSEPIVPVSETALGLVAESSAAPNIEMMVFASFWDCIEVA
ncbi:hypothetical protein GN958_ATG00242, partial [Phytophthora infestans]